MTLALLLHVQILGLLHPQAALVDGQQAQIGHRYGGERFTIEVPGLKPRTYAGALVIEDGGTGLRLVNEVDLEDYVASVVAAEMDIAPEAAREALAIVARSFAIHAQAQGHLCDTTHCQWYRGSKGADIASARKTAGQVLKDSADSPAAAFHSQDCGGATRTGWHTADRTPDPHLPGQKPGHGHGVGLCQRGAVFQASKGASVHQILARYFPGLHTGQL